MIVSEYIWNTPPRAGMCNMLKHGHLDRCRFTLSAFEYFSSCH